jgi:hypothetical protein
VDATAHDVVSGRGVAGVDAIVTSPPYISGGHHADQTGAWGGCAGEAQRHTKDMAGYGTAAGQIGRLKGDPGTPEDGPMPEVETLDWRGCYAERWADLLCPEAMAHPAKFAPGLLARLYAHGFARGWWRKGDLVADCFAGVACGGVLAAYKGLRWLGVELEERFVALARRNFELHRRRWEAAGDPVPVIVRGDSRRFAEAVRGAAGLVTSPPYADTPLNPGESSRPEAKVARLLAEGKYREADAVRIHGSGLSGNLRQQDYGATPGQIGALAAGDVDAVVTSPPFMGQTASPGKDRGDYFGPVGGVRHEGADYDETMPYQSRGFLMGREGYKEWAARCNLGSITTSAPTYWSEVAKVYAQCLLAMKPGGVACIVVKGYVRKGRLVDLPGQTLRLLLSLGFEPVERIRAWLVEERREAGLFGDVVESKSRKSFFRRLAEKKGAPAIDWEEVLIVRKLLTPEAP